ncbi:MAG: SagB/ThcOx family dehydrogenase [Planctomycetota bacterium]
MGRLTPLVILAILLTGCADHGDDGHGAPGAATTAAPAPTTAGGMALTETLRRRRSVRDFRARPLTEEQIAQLAWAAQGVTDPRGFRTAPSAGALYPIDLYVVTAEEVRRYLPGRHAFETVEVGDQRPALAKAAVNQTWLAKAPVTFAVCVVYERTTQKYGDRGRRYAIQEVGHVCQNLHLQAVALGLGSVPVGAFQDERVRRLLGAPPDHHPICLVCVGHPRVPTP